MLSVLTGLVFGLAPAIQATRVDLMPALKEVRAGALAGTAGRGWSRVGLSQVLVVAQIAFSLVLLVAAGLFGRTLSNLHAIELGFNRENVLLFTIRPGAVGYEGPALKRLYGDLRERLGQVPGVRSVSLSSSPLPAGGGTMAPVTAVGVPPPSGGCRGAPTQCRGCVQRRAGVFRDHADPVDVRGANSTSVTDGGAPPVAVINQQAREGPGAGESRREQNQPWRATHVSKSSASPGRHSFST